MFAEHTNIIFVKSLRHTENLHVSESGQDMSYQLASSSFSSCDWQAVSQWKLDGQYVYTEKRELEVVSPIQQIHKTKDFLV